MKTNFVSRTLIGLGIILSLSFVLKDALAVKMYQPKVVISSNKKASRGKQMVRPQSVGVPMCAPSYAASGVSGNGGQNQGFIFTPAVDWANPPLTGGEGALNTNLFNLWTGCDYFGANGQTNTGLDFFKNLQRPRSPYDSFTRVNNWLNGQPTSFEHETTSPFDKTRKSISGRQ